MKGKSLSILLIFSLALNLAVFGTFIFFKLIKPDFYRPNFERSSMIDKNFNEEQREQLFKKFRELHRATKAGRQEIIKLENEMFDLLLSDSTNKEEVNLLVEEIGKLKLEQSKLVINRLFESKDILNKEQRARFMRMLMKDKPGFRGEPGRSGDERKKNRRRSLNQ